MRITSRQLVYLYAALVILEGAIRKWLAPEALNPLVAIARDPIALVLLWQGWQRGLLQPSWLRSLWLITSLGMAIGGLLSLYSTSVPLSLWVYGLRTNLLHLPLILIIPGLLEREDLDVLLRRLLRLSLPIALIMLWQYRSPLSSWINRGAFEGVTQIIAVADKVRPPGPFSFITGAAEYFALINAYIAGCLFDRSLKNGAIFYGLFATILALSVSGSRLMIATLGVVWVGSVVVHQMRRLRLPNTRMTLTFLGVGGALVMLLTLTPVGTLINEGWSTTSDRLETANNTDGGVLSRFISTVSVPEDILWRTPIFGHGLGLGTNFGAKTISGKVGFALAESEVQRVILESGLILGGLFLLFRFCLGAYIASRAWWALGQGQQLAISLFFANLTTLLFGQITRPTSMGFVVLSMAFSLCAARSATPSEQPES